MHRLWRWMCHLLLRKLLHNLQQLCYHSSRWCLLQLSLPLLHLRRHWSLHSLSQWVLLLPRCLSDCLPTWLFLRQRSLSMHIGHYFSRSMCHQLRFRLHCSEQFMPTMQLQLRSMSRHCQHLYFLHLRVSNQCCHFHLCFSYSVSLRSSCNKRSLCTDLLYWLLVL
jgi:hypothetical protein